MRKRQPITPETVHRSLEPINRAESLARSNRIFHPFEHTWYIPATRQVMDDDRFYNIKRNEGDFTNTGTLKGAERRMYLLGVVTTKTFVVPEHLPRKSDQLMLALLNDEMAKIAVASVSITSRYPICMKAEHATLVRVAVHPDTPALEAATQGVAAFLNGGEGLLDADAIADFDERLEATRRMAAIDKRSMVDILDI